MKLDDQLKERVAALKGSYVFETYISFSCHNCPDVVQMFNLMALINPRIQSVAIDGNRFREEVDARNVQGVPMMYVNGQHFGQGRTDIEDVLARLAGDELKVTHQA